MLLSNYVIRKREEKMKKSELLNKISNRIGIQRATCESVLDAMIDEIKDALVMGDKVSIQGFMTFDLGERGERKARNPATGEITTFPAVKTIKCKMSREIKDAINNKGI